MTNAQAMPSSDVASIIDALRLASVELHGERVVRLSEAAKLVGRGQSLLNRWSRKGLMRMTRVNVTPGGGCPKGVFVFINLEDLEKVVRQRSSVRTWERISKNDILIVRAMIGLESTAAIAKRLGRTRIAVRYIARQEFGSVLGGAKHANGVVTVGDFARMVGRNRNTVRTWIQQGMPTIKGAGERFRYMIRLTAARQWMQGRHELLLRLEPSTRKALRLTLPASSPRGAA